MYIILSLLFSVTLLVIFFTDDGDSASPNRLFYLCTFINKMDL